MGYLTNINQSKQKVYEKAVATKILDLMDKLRIYSKENDKRRWVWELLQNAKDVKVKELGYVDVIVKLDLDSNVLIFQHNGECFSTDNITFLIEQVSTKERSDNDETTGKFGTGFLTTHLLSQIVEVQGIVKDENLPYRQFCITLDRSSDQLSEIIESVNTSIKKLESLENAEDYENYNPTDFNTRFTYDLDENGIDTALKGIRDLESSLPLNLAFLPAIRRVEIEYGDTIQSFSIKDRYKIDIDEDETDLSAEIIKIEKISTNEETYYEFISIKSNNSQIAFPVNYFYGKQVPRIFCDFPLVGSENFGIPFFVNSHKFYPTEPRDGIFLTDKDDNKIKLNKDILIEAVSSYLKLIEYVSRENWNNLYVFARISSSSKSDWLSSNWYTENIILPIQDKIYKTPLVKTKDGTLISLVMSNNAIVDIPFDDKSLIRELIWDLVDEVEYFWLPAKSDIHQWYDIFKDSIWNKDHRLTVTTLSKHISDNNSSLNDLRSNWGIDDPITWLNQYFEILQKAEENPIEFLRKNDFKIIPNQYENFCGFTPTLYHDSGIENALKDIGIHLECDYRQTLVHSSINISKLFSSKTQNSVIDEINKRLKSCSENTQQKVSNLLTHLFPKLDAQGSNNILLRRRSMIYDVSKKLFAGDILERETLNNWSPEIWEISDKLQSTFIVRKISKFQNLSSLSSDLSEDIDDTCNWLSQFANLLINLDWKNLLGEQTPILPNQNGTFCELDDLSVEGEPIDENLKNIAAALNRDFRDDLINIAFDIEILKKRQIFQKDIAKDIKELVIPLLAELPRTKKTQNIFNNLVLWMHSNEKIAKDIFSDLFENRHKLYDDDEIAANLRKVPELEYQVELLLQEKKDLQDQNEALIAEIEMLKSDLENRKYDTVQSEKEEIDDDFLITYGITTREQLESILNDPKISRNYSCSNTEDYFSRLEYVLEIIARAKLNVRAYLETLEEYDCQNWKEIGPTYIKGVKKRNESIEIIIRPSDNRKIIFYYPEEKEILSRTDSELWVEDDITNPRQITLGIVLKIQDIDEIDLPNDF